MYQMNGYRGDWGYRRGWGRGPHPFFIFPMLLLAGFVFFGLFRFFLPLIALGLIFVGIKTLVQGGRGGRGGWGQWRSEGGREFWNQGWNWENRWGDRWHDKRKHDWMSDEKSKNDDNGDEPRYTRAPNGEWVEII